MPTCQGGIPSQERYSIFDKVGEVGRFLSHSLSGADANPMHPAYIELQIAAAISRIARTQGYRSAGQYIKQGQENLNRLANGKQLR